MVTPAIGRLASPVSLDLDLQTGTGVKNTRLAPNPVGAPSPALRAGLPTESIGKVVLAGNSSSHPMGPGDTANRPLFPPGTSSSTASPTTLSPQSPLFRGHAFDAKPTVSAGLLRLLSRLEYWPTTHQRLALLDKLGKEEPAAASELLTLLGGPSKLPHLLSIAKGGRAELVSWLHAVRGERPPERTSIADQIEFLAALIDTDAHRLRGLSRADISVGSDALGPHLRLEVSGLIEPHGRIDSIRRAFGTDLPDDMRLIVTTEGHPIEQLVGRKLPGLPANIGYTLLSAFGQLENGGLRLELPETTRVPFGRGELQFRHESGRQLVYATFAKNATTPKIDVFSAPLSPTPEVTKTVEAPVVPTRPMAERAAEYLQSLLPGANDEPYTFGSTRVHFADIAASEGRAQLTLIAQGTTSGKADARDQLVSRSLMEIDRLMTLHGFSGAQLAIDVRIDGAPAGESLHSMGHGPTTRAGQAVAWLNSGGLGRYVAGHPGAETNVHFQADDHGIRGKVFVVYDAHVFGGNAEETAQAAVAQMEAATLARLRAAGFGGFPITLST